MGLGHAPYVTKQLVHNGAQLCSVIVCAILHLVGNFDKK
jgi:hypothetical protein